MPQLNNLAELALLSENKTTHRESLFLSNLEENLTNWQVKLNGYFFVHLNSPVYLVFHLRVRDSNARFRMFLQIYFSQEMLFTDLLIRVVTILLNAKITEPSGYLRN